MTLDEFYKLAVDLTQYNPRINKSTRTIFLKRLRETPGALEQAYALFGDRGTYYADMKDFNKFIQDTVKVTAKGIDKTKYRDYSKYSTSFEANNKKGSK